METLAVRSLGLVDAARGITPTATTWDSNPSDLANATDGDETTATGTGSKSISSATTFGAVNIDLGQLALYDLSATIAYWAQTTSSSCTIYWDYKKASGDSMRSHASSHSGSGGTTEWTTLAEMPVVRVYTRYIALRFVNNTTNNQTYYGKVGSIRAHKVG